MASRDTHASAHRGVAHGVEGQAGTWGDFAWEGVWSVRALGIRTPFPGRLTHVVERRLRVWSVDGIVPYETFGQLWTRSYDVQNATQKSVSCAPRQPASPATVFRDVRQDHAQSRNDSRIPMKTGKVVSLMGSS